MRKSMWRLFVGLLAAAGTIAFTTNTEAGRFDFTPPPKDAPSLVQFEDQKSGFPPVNGTKSAGDHYFVGGKRIDLVRATNEVAVRYAAGVDFESAHKTLNTGVDAKRVGAFEPGRLDIVRATPAKGAAKGASLEKALAANPSVERTFPVLVYPVDGVRMIVTDEVLICMKQGTTVGEFDQVLMAHGGELVKKTLAKDADIYLVRFPKEADVLGLTRELGDESGVEWAQPNFVREFRQYYMPSDPLFQYQQTMHNPGGDGRVADADVDAPEAWDITQGDSNIVIAVIDDGVDTSHPEMNIAPGGYDFYNENSDPNPVGTDGHGTGCAGIIAAIGNTTGMSGIARNCKILPIKVSQSSASLPPFVGDEALGSAIRYAADRADVLSNSWGGGSENQYINSAIDYSNSSGRGGLGAPVFFASGNSSSIFDRGGGRQRISVSLTGQYYFVFEYSKDSSSSAGLDAVLIDNFCIIGPDNYTTVYREDFEGATFPPTNWGESVQGVTGWYQDTANANTSTGGTKSARSPAMANGQWTALISPLFTFNGTESAVIFSRGVSSEEGYDLLTVYVYDGGNNYIGALGPYSGVPDTASTSYPASYANSIAVGTATDTDNRAAYSQYGPEIDFLAPSNGGWHDVVSLDPLGSTGWNSGDYKFNFGGTSSACPLAAGIAALLLSVDDSLTYSEVRTMMRQNCDKVGPLSYTGGISGAGGRNNQYGYGRINAHQLLLDAQQATPTPTPSPTPGGINRSVGDLNGDNCTNLADFLTLTENWGEVYAPMGPPAIRLADFLNLLDNWQMGTGCAE